MPDQPPPRLKPPGSGIPAIQRVVAARLLLPLFVRKHPWDAIPGLLQSDARTLLESFSRQHATGGDERVTRRVLIPPTPGLEDDSRYWSLAMVLDHLRRVNTRMIDIVHALSTGSPLSDGPSKIVDFKPDPAATRDAAPAYRAATDELSDAIRAVPMNARASVTTTPHPWFGPLTLRQWVPFTAMHQRIHRRQWDQILKRL